jgi:three-Cys-motif partner protein
MVKESFVARASRQSRSAKHPHRRFLLTYISQSEVASKARRLPSALNRFSLPYRLDLERRKLAGLGDHEFGSVSTDLKLELLEGYLKAFTRALRAKFNNLWYVDAYAGTGRRTVKILERDPDLLDEGVEAEIVQRRGSAQIAIDTDPAFNRLVFIDLNRRHVKALGELKQKHETSIKRIDVVRQDANVAIRELIRGHKFTGTRAVMFLDPYGLGVSWETLEAIAQTGAIDVWYFVSLEGLFRQAAHDQAKINDKKRAAITRMLGTADWETAWYSERQSLDLFGHNDSGQRVADIDAMEAYVQKRLEVLFPKVLPPLRLKNKAGVNSAALFFAISNKDGKAIGLATRIASAVLKNGRQR